MSSRTTPRAVSLGAALPLMFVAAAPVRAGLVLSDDTFNSADWVATIVATADGGPHTVQQELTGGNPGAYRHMMTEMPASSFLQVVHHFLGGSYDPSVQGAILSLDYTEDRIVFEGAPGLGGPALVQDGVFYRRTPVGVFSNTTWGTATLTGLTETDFLAFDGSTPDFSSSGSTIQFGYLRVDSNGSSDPVVIQHGIDNWSFTVHAVPEPSSLALLCTGSLVLAGFGRRRKEGAHSHESRQGLR